MLDSLILNFRGELAALSAALIWAIASIIYIRLGKQLPPLVLNLSKSAIAIVLIGLTLGLRGDFLPETTPAAVGLLLTSGAIGIGFGDTAFFEALNCLGVRRCLLMEALAPPLTALLALIFLGEQLTALSYLGIGLTVAGVSWVIVERVPDAGRGNFRPLRGVGFGMIAALGQAGGSVMSRAALASTEISPLWSTLIRLAAGVAVLLIWAVFQQRGKQGFRPLRSPRLLAILTLAAFFSTYLAIWLQQTAFKFTAAGIAQALSATSPLFVIPVAMWMGDRVSPRAILGVLVALGGVWLLFGG
ncbi:MAG: DMT family transporter [Leptolyngbyaceae cyanobacterium SL_5_9]|nr:DMT family transporter [Leptolyngbyaceae cyanobacterium SL_5_9]NJO75642.1 DMT family transporter [Leptolyngbyaceae cyanobacterium RM1_406_9]